MRIRAREFALYATDCRTRIPFRFGDTTLTGAPLLTARVVIDTEEGERREGFSADLLVPRWFDKDPAKSISRNVEDLVASARHAGEALVDPSAPPLTAFEHWWRVYSGADIGPESGLVTGFGIALLERALIDATCRAADVSFFRALREDLLGFRPDVVRAELSGWDVRASLGAEPLDSVQVRHTVGLLDPLLSADVSTNERVDDGLPQALEEDVGRYGLRCFKLKISGDVAANVARLVAIARVLRETAGDEVLVTLDGNEQVEDLADLTRLFDGLAADPDGAWLLAAIEYVEQPLSRSRSFDPDATAGLASLSKPVILDEADYGAEAFPLAVDRGYRGVSVKNCKGVFRALVNRGLCEVLGEGLFQSAEDLTNLAVLPLQQDLATVAALGLPHVERNGHHYFAGLGHLPREEAEEALIRHPDLYERGRAGVVLRIADGRLALGSLQGPGFGYDVEVRHDRRTPASGWRFEAR